MLCFRDADQFFYFLLFVGKQLNGGLLTTATYW